MRSLFRPLILIVVLGAAIRQDWLWAGTRFASSALGLPPGMEPGGLPDGGALMRGLVGLVQGLPDPWYTLTLMIAGLSGLVFLASLLRTTVRATQRLSGLVRDVSV